METTSAEASGGLRTPSIPIPPPRAGQIDVEDLIGSATRAVLRAVAELNPQPLPPQDTISAERVAAPLNPQPLPPGDIIVGIIFSPRDILAARAPQAEV